LVRLSVAALHRTLVRSWRPGRGVLGGERPAVRRAPPRRSCQQRGAVLSQPAQSIADRPAGVPGRVRRPAAAGRHGAGSSSDRMSRARNVLWLAGLVGLLLVYGGVSLRHLTTVPPVYEDEPGQASTGWKLATSGTFGSDLFTGFHGMERRYYGFMPIH